MTAQLKRFLASVLIAFRAVRRNKLRASLTILGITIGIAAVVTVTSLATGARERVQGQISGLGSNALLVFSRSTRTSGLRNAAEGSRLSELDVQALVREATSIRWAAPFLRSNGQVVHEGQNVTSSLIGTRLAYFSIRNWNIAEGELWSATAENIAERVVVIGKDTAATLFGATDPIGRNIRIGRHTFRVLGVLEEKGSSPFGNSQDEIVLMPSTTMRSFLLSTRPYETHAIMLSATGEGTTARAKAQTEAILRQRHRIREGEEDDFRVRSQNEFQAMQDTIYGALSALLISIAAVSLVVGGIGVMNIMLVSVTERTREIGIRMAIGAREADILTQFLMEALVLSTVGGLVGTTVGYGAILGFATALDWPMKLDPVALAIALGISTTIGLVFGFFPAQRAARMDPVQALGRE
ncbi:ABC transporter permease [Chondromyces crocatus]|uniref:Multidrug ABC transporter substrate-binding protein n=1 Tax=Chondromyces crocatus TaxID=52 RepID=A0A0K1ERT4_CHOCO|nr:ABC transporter permease [Chondromyces crocatus]AKT43372.1 multidrug ABC transporter substrate-binding protein [Chondromyces crocatus]